VIICAVLAVLTSRSAPALPTRTLDRFAAGAQIITGQSSTDRPNKAATPNRYRKAASLEDERFPLDEPI